MKNKLIPAVCAVAAALATTGCAMTVDALRYADFTPEGYPVVVERRTERDALMLTDDMNDSDVVYAANRSAEDVCLRFQSTEYSGDTGYWTVPAQSEILLRRHRMSGSWSLHSRRYDPDCNRWS